VRSVPVLKALRNVVEWAATAMAAALLLAFAGWMTVPRLLGWTPQIVLSGSMEPALPVGSVVFTVPVDPESVRTGDVITFRNPDRPGTLVSHRVVGVERGPAGLAIKTKGDANPSEDQWAVGADDIVGRVRWHVPYLGYVTDFVRTPLGFLTVIAFPGAIIIFGEVTSIVRELRARKATGGVA
jgi:signal peptidase